MSSPLSSNINTISTISPDDPYNPVNFPIRKPCPVEVKIDHKQAKFTIEPHLLPTARCVIYKRYNDPLLWPKPNQCIWIDESYSQRGPAPRLRLDHAIHSDINNIPNQVPPELYLSRIYIDKEDARLVTLTIFYTTGTIRIQGNYCPEWRQEEANSLYALINFTWKNSQCTKFLPAITIPNSKTPPPSITQTPHRYSLRSKERRSLYDEPLRAIQAVTTSPLTASTLPNPPASVLIVTSPTVIITSPLVSSPSPTTTTLQDIQVLPTMLMLEGPQSTTSNNLNHPNHPTLNLTPENEIGPCLAFEGDPNKLNENESPNLCNNHIDRSGLAFEDDQNQATVTETSNDCQRPRRAGGDINEHDCETDIDTCIKTSEWEDVKDGNNESKGHSINRKSPKRKKTRRQQKLTPINFGNIKKELKRGFQILRNMKLQMKQDKNDEISRIEQAKVQTKMGIKVHYDKKIEAFHNVINIKNKEIANLQSDSKKLMKECNDLKGQVKELRNKLKIATSTKNQLSQTDTTSKSGNTPDPKTQTSSCVTVDGEKNKSKSKSPNALCQEKPGKEGSIEMKQRRQQQIPDDERNVNNLSRNPRQILSQRQIKPETTSLIIGDSVTKYLQSHLIYGHSKSETISVSGMTVDDLIYWLRHKPSYLNINEVICHVGVNTAKSLPIDDNKWDHLIKLMKRTFPSAKMIMSSIIPNANDDPQLETNIDTSNFHLHSVCHNHGVATINNTPTFTFGFQNPNLTMYYDRIHPSRKGTAALARNIKQSLASQRESKTRMEKRKQDSTAHQVNQQSAHLYAGAAHPQMPRIMLQPSQHNQRRPAPESASQPQSHLPDLRTLHIEPKQHWFSGPCSMCGGNCAEQLCAHRWLYQGRPFPGQAVQHRPRPGQSSDQPPMTRPLPGHVENQPPVSRPLPGRSANQQTMPWPLPGQFDPSHIPRPPPGHTWPYQANLLHLSKTWL